MSGGSMGYLYSQVEEAGFFMTTPERRALKAHLDKLAKALRAVEWNDSGDGADDESALIREVIGDRAILETAIQHAKEAHKDLGDQLARVEVSWLSKEMQTPAKGFPALRPKWVLVGDKVRVKDGLPLPRGLYSGQVGKVASVYGGEIQVAFEQSWLHFMQDDLDPADLEPSE
jgi:hypothetical protein